MLVIFLFAVALAFQEGVPRCRTRTAEDSATTTSSRLIFTPHVRLGSLVANTFFAAAEFAGLLGDKRALPDVLPCVMSEPDERTGRTTFIPVRGGISAKVAFPESHACVDPQTNLVVSTLRDVQGEIFIVGHGNGMEARLEIGYGKDGTVDKTSYGAGELADLLIENGLACDHKKVTLLLVQGGAALTKEQVNRRYIELFRKMRSPSFQTKDRQESLRGEWGSLAMRQRDPDLWENNANIAKREIVFVSMLAAALAERGLASVEVTGFHGEVLSRLGKRATNPGPYSGLKMYVTSAMLAESFCADEPDGEAKAECVDKLVAPCDQCMLDLARSSPRTGFIQRSRICQRRLLAKSATYRAAQVCGAEATYATPQWIYTVRGTDLEGDIEP